MIKAEIRPNIEAKRIDVRHLRKHARTKSMAAVMLGNVVMDESKAVGNLTGEYEDGVSWDSLELPESIKSRFRTARYENGWFDSETKAEITRAQAVVALGPETYYLP